MNMEFEWSVLLRIIALGALIVCSGFFSGSETALFSLSKLQLQKIREDRTKRGNIVLLLLSKPKRLLIAILMGNESVNISISAISTSLVLHFLADQFQFMDPKWFNILLVVPFLLLFGEVIPKTLAIQNNERHAFRVCNLLRTFQKMVSPLVWVIFKLTDLVVFLVVGERTKKEHPIMEEEFITLIEDSSEAGVIGENEKKLIHRVFELGNMPVSKVMTPRGSIFFLSVNVPLKEVVEEVSTNRHRIIPVYEENRDRIVGILHPKKLLDLTEEMLETGKIGLRDLLDQPVFIPEIKPVYDLFKEFKSKKNRIAIVLDEFGGVIGLASISDILEELFGRIDEMHNYDRDSAYEKLSDNRWMIDASIPIEELAVITKTRFYHEEFETFGGFVFGLFGKLPAVGDVITYKHLRLTIREVDLTIITKIEVERLNKRKEEPTPPKTEQ
ncbi:MAG: HlyC/CorC family transporter [SAR324 cluster bacterium]|nr:HlyC/CorC family transporter [SAR324 cluster bacterium]